MNQPVATTVHETLQFALDLLRTDGWCRRTLFNSDGEHCARGALIAVVQEYRVAVVQEYRVADYVRTTGLRAQAEEVLVAQIPDDFELDPNDVRDRLPQYNNSRADFSEVETWFEKAIADETVRGA